MATAITFLRVAPLKYEFHQVYKTVQYKLPVPSHGTPPLIGLDVCLKNRANVFFNIKLKVRLL